MDYREAIKDYLEREIQVLQNLDQGAIKAAMEAIVTAWREGKTVYTMGNGGSASTASHMVCDFNKGVSEAVGKNKFRFNCLSDNTALTMAIANDIAYDDIFVFQLRGSVKPGDLIIALSGSGNSENVIRAVKYAKEQGAKIIALTGYNGGKLKELADYPLHVAVDDMQIAEDVHLIFNHLIMQVLSRGL
ncbi:MAG: SIS domain-containing protein [Selenomonadaceae bacterium]|nr:SIS domain-containing protein [Selenomonadaceae bacterium]